MLQFCVIKIQYKPIIINLCNLYKKSVPNSGKIIGQSKRNSRVESVPHVYLPVLTVIIHTYTLLRVRRIIQTRLNQNLYEGPLLYFPTISILRKYDDKIVTTKYDYFKINKFSLNKEKNHYLLEINNIPNGNYIVYQIGWSIIKLIFIP